MNTKDISSEHKLALLFGITFIAVVVALLLPAIPQDISYHQFADQRYLLEIPNLFNVVSNIPFVIVGGLGIKLLITNKSICIIPKIYPAYLIFFISVFFVGIGSAYYHLFPSNITLIFDRLPMTVAFMAFFTIILSEFVSLKADKLLIPLLALGIFSIGYWYFTEQQGAGDLRWYGLVQFLPILLISLVLLLFSSPFSHAYLYWYFLGVYVLAKIFEANDELIYQNLHLVSGHSIKHLFAGAGCYIFYLQLQRRSVLLPI